MRHFTRYSRVAGFICLLSLAASSAVFAAIGPGWLMYENSMLHFAISYPKSWRVDRAYVYPGFGPDHDIHGVGFEVPNSLTKGTNLSTTLTGVSVESVPRGKSCDARRFLPDVEGLHTLRQDGRVWSVANSSDAGAGNFYEITVYALSTKTQCLAVRMLIHSTNIANYDPGSVKEFNRKTLVATFDRIRRSLKLRGEK